MCLCLCLGECEAGGSKPLYLSISALLSSSSSPHFSSHTHTLSLSLSLSLSSLWLYSQSLPFLTFSTLLLLLHQSLRFSLPPTMAATSLISLVCIANPSEPGGNSLRLLGPSRTLFLRRRSKRFLILHVTIAPPRNRILALIWDRRCAFLFCLDYCFSE